MVKIHGCPATVSATKAALVSLLMKISGKTQQVGMFNWHKSGDLSPNEGPCEIGDSPNWDSPQINGGDDFLISLRG